MADAAISVVKLAVQHLGRLVVDEAKYLHEVKSKVEGLHDELRWMQVFLEDADTKLLNKSKLVNLWISQIYDFSYEAEDTVNKYIHGVLLKNQDGILNTLKWGCYAGFNVGYAKTLHEVGSEIDALTQKIARLSSRMQTYKVDPKSGEEKPPSSTPRKVTPVQDVRTVRYSGVFFYDIPGLTPDAARKLFKKKAGLTESSTDYCDKILLLEEMLPKCCARSSLIELLGKTLSTLEDVGDWQTVNNGITAEDQEGCAREISEMSYWALPNQLKPLLLYLGMFPKGSEMQPNKLYGWWAAEGMITAREGQTSEALAEMYLHDLAHRSVVNVLTDSNDRITFVKLPNPMRKVCLREARKDNFLNIVSSDDDSFAARSHDDDDESEHAVSLMSADSTSVRRLAIHMDEVLRDYCADHADTVFCKAPYLRTLFLYSVNGCEVGRVNELIKRLSRSYPSMRVLSLSIKTRESSLPKAIGKFMHLRFLSLEGCVFQHGCELPSTIGSLRSLQTLDLRAHGGGLITIPNVFSILKQLIHVYLPSNHRARIFDKFRFDSLNRLKTLENLDLRHCRDQDFLKLKRLRKVTIRGPVRKREFSKLKSLLAHPRIRSDRLMRPLVLAIEGGAFSGDPSMLSGCKSLGRLTIQDAIPVPISSTVIQSLEPLGNLHWLYLKGTQLREDSLPLFGKLPKLEYLFLESCSYLGEDMVCSSAHGFPRLHNLRISGLSKLERCRVEEGAIPNLYGLSIQDCDHLKMIAGSFPSLGNLELHKLPKLEELAILGSVSHPIQYLEIDGCPNLTTTPEGFTVMTHCNLSSR